MKTNKPLVAKGKVSLPWQAVFSIITPLDIWAFYRIEKLQKAILYIAIPSIVICMVFVVILYDDDDGLDMESENLLDESFLIQDVIITVGFMGWSVFLMIRWSEEWNKKFNSNL